MVAGGGSNSYLLMKAITADCLLEVDDVYDIIDGLSFLEANLETLNLIMNIPAVLGVGYAAQEDNFDFDYSESLGYINICKEDLHALFAETVFSGRPRQAPEVQAQVAIGVKLIPADLEVKAAHKGDVKFSHFVQHYERRAEVQAVKANVHVKLQLQTAKSQEEAFTITCDAFLAHLRCLLHITEEENLNDASSFVEQGADSLVAVDTRA